MFLNGVKSRVESPRRKLHKKPKQQQHLYLLLHQIKCHLLRLLHIDLSVHNHQEETMIDQREVKKKTFNSIHSSASLTLFFIRRTSWFSRTTSTYYYTISSTSCSNLGNLSANKIFSTRHWIMGINCFYQNE